MSPRRTTSSPTGLEGQAAPDVAQAPGVPAEGAAGPTYEEIARRAYELCLERGGEPGRDLEDWLRAEADLQHGSG